MRVVTVLKFALVSMSSLVLLVATGGAASAQGILEKVIEINNVGSGDPGLFTVFDGKLYFEAGFGPDPEQDEPAVYDPATNTVNQITNNAPLAGNDSNLTDLFVHAGSLYAVMESNVGRELFVYDATDGANGAFNIVNNLNGNDDGFPLIQDGNLPILGGDLYLNAREASGPTDRELYRLTSAGVLEKVIEINNVGSGDPGLFTVFDGKLYFEAGFGPDPEQDEPAVYDPATNTVNQITNNAPLAGNDSNLTDLFVHAGSLYAVMESNVGRELFVYDATDGANGAFNIVNNLNGNDDGFPLIQDGNLPILGGDLYLNAREASGPTDRELYRLTSAGVLEKVIEINNVGSGDPGLFTVFDGKLYFEAGFGPDPEQDEPAVYDPATNTVNQITNNAPLAGNDSNLTDLFVHAGSLYAVMESNVGRELFVYDATDGANGAFNIVNNLNGNDDGFPLIQDGNLPILGGDLYLNAREATPTDRELYRLTGFPPNTAPTATNTTQTVSYVEDAATAAITDIVVTDADAGEQITATITLANTSTGAFTANDGATYTAGTGVWTITGTVAQVNTALAGVAFTPAADNGTDTTAGVNIADGGEDGAAAVTGTITLDVTPVNDEPDVTFAGNETVNEDAGAQSTANFATLSPGGGSDESGQTVTASVTNSNTTLFSTQPAIATNGTLTYAPAANANGSATVTVVATDDGGTANGGDDTSPDRTFTITVNAVNDEPSFVTSPAGDDQTVDEDAGAQSVAAFASGAAGGGPDESGQAIAFGVANDNNGLFSAQPALDAAGELTYTPAADANGTATVSVTVIDDGGTANGGDDTSAAVTFDITLNAVNDAPVVSLDGNQTVNEDAGAQTVAGFATLSAGPANEAGQTLTINASNDNNALFSTQPTIASNGTLSYTPAADGNGTATVTVSVSDDGGTTNGGDDTADDQTFTITVAAANEEPFYTTNPAGDDQTVSEDAGAQTITGFAAASPGPADESGQTIAYALTNDNNALFSAQPSIDAAGELTYTPAADANGTATVTVILSDDGGTANGGDDTADAVTFDITVTPVNDEPVITVTLNPVVDEDAGAQTGIDVATTTPGGGADEAGQTLTTTLTNDNTALFSVQPDFDGAGELFFTPTANANGVATVTIAVSDDGGTANGGDDSAQATFTITVSAVNDEPVYVINPADDDQTVAENAGPQTVTDFATAAPGGGTDEATQTVALAVTNDDNTLFSAQPTIDGSGALTYTPADDANGVADVTVSLTDDGGTTNGGDDTAPDVTFTITITAVNSAPTVTLGADPTIDEDAGPQTVPSFVTTTPGPGADEAGQTVTVTVSSTNPALFDAEPAVDAAGELTFTPAADANGSSTVTITATDDGGTANGGDDTTERTATITVNAVNDEPTITTAPVDQTVAEDAGAQTVAAAVVAAPGGGADEDGQALSYAVTNDNNDLFAAGPAIDTDGQLTYTPAEDANGTATLTVSLSDDGGTANGGDDTADPVTFDITVTAVNDAPTLDVGDDQGVAVDAGAQTVEDFATTTPGGGDDEADQTVSFVVTTDNDDLFDVAPTIDGQGTLTYTPSGGAGQATVTVLATDDGGTAGGGQDTSAPQTFVIAVAQPGSLSIDDVSVVEGAEDDLTPATFTVTLSEAQATPVTVLAETGEGTADVDADYEPVSTTLEIAAGDTTATVAVPVIGDDLVEADETFTVTLSAVIGAAVIEDGEGVGTITNDDEDPATPRPDNSDISVLSAQQTFPDGLNPDDDPEVNTTVLLANDDIFADSLASGVLQPDAPLLLTDRSGLETEVAGEMERLGATDVRILGGIAAVPKAIEDDLIARGYTVERTFGPTRVETAIAIAELFPDVETAILARAYGLPDGSNPSTAFADSLAAGALASDTGYPILLTETDRLTATTRAYLESSPITSLLVVGGPAAIADTVLDELTELGITVERWSGDDRSATAVAVAIARGFVGTVIPDGAVIVEGWEENAWAAGFTLAGYADRNNSPILLANGPDLPDPTADFLTEIKVANADATLQVCRADETACAAAEAVLEP